MTSNQNSRCCGKCGEPFHRMSNALDGAICGRCKAASPTVYYCSQCKRDMGNEWILGPVCGKCCRANHKAVAGS